MSDRIAVMNDGRDRAARHAAGDLRAPGDQVRRRLHRHLEPAGRPGRPRRRGPRGARAAAADERVIVPVSGGRGTTPGTPSSCRSGPRRSTCTTAEPAAADRSVLCAAVVTEVVYLGTSTNYNVITSTGAEVRGLRPERLATPRTLPVAATPSSCPGTLSTRTRLESDERTAHLDPALLRGMTQRRLSRRDALRISGLSAPALALAACGVKGQGTPSPTSARRRRGRHSSGPARPRTASWTSPTGRSTWTRRSPSSRRSPRRPASRSTTRRSSRRWGPGSPRCSRSSPAGQSIGFDLMVITNGIQFKQFVQSGLPGPAGPRASCPTSRPTRRRRTRTSAYDKGNVYSVPWASGMTGIAYDPEKVTGADHQAGRPVEPGVRGQGRHVLRHPGAGQLRPAGARHRPGHVHPGRLAARRPTSSRSRRTPASSATTTTRATSTPSAAARSGSPRPGRVTCSRRTSPTARTSSS